jgi:hypothetical protein
MREIRTSGSEGGVSSILIPTPILPHSRLPPANSAEGRMPPAISAEGGGARSFSKRSVGMGGALA